MGMNLPAKAHTAGERTATRIRLFLDADGGTPDRNKFAYIDIAQCLSVMNQRAYRQGLYYYVAGVTIHNTADARVVFSTVPDTWTTKESWKRGFRAWSRMNRDATASNNRVMPKYHDFKVFMDTDHVALATVAVVDRGDQDAEAGTTVDNQVWSAGNNLLPVAYDKLNADTASAMPTSLTCDEWAQSVYVAHDSGGIGGPNAETDSFLIHVVGAHGGDGTPYTTCGLIRSYTNTRPFTGEDNMAGSPRLESSADGTAYVLEDDPIVSIFDHGDTHQDILKDLDDFNDVAPYQVGRPFGYDNDELYQVAQAKTQASGGGSIVRMSGFCAPFGLVRIDMDDTTGIEIVLDIVPGGYKGVYAERVI